MRPLFLDFRPFNWKILVKSIIERVWSLKKAIQTFINVVIWRKKVCLMIHINGHYVMAGGESECHRAHYCSKESVAKWVVLISWLLPAEIQKRGQVEYSSGPNEFWTQEISTDVASQILLLIFRHKVDSLIQIVT